MYVLCLIDFEQTISLSWVCVLTFHIFRPFLIFLALLYICNKLFGPVCLCVKKESGCPRPAFLFCFCFYGFVCLFFTNLTGHIRFPRHSYPDHRFAICT